MKKCLFLFGFIVGLTLSGCNPDSRNTAYLLSKSSNKNVLNSSSTPELNPVSYPVPGTIDVNFGTDGIWIENDLTDPHCDSTMVPFGSRLFKVCGKKTGSYNFAESEIVSVDDKNRVTKKSFVDVFAGLPNNWTMKNCGFEFLSSTKNISLGWLTCNTTPNSQDAKYRVGIVKFDINGNLDLNFGQAGIVELTPSLGNSRPLIEAKIQANQNILLTFQLSSINNDYRTWLLDPSGKRLPLANNLFEARKFQSPFLVDSAPNKMIDISVFLEDGLEPSDDRSYGDFYYVAPATKDLVADTSGSEFLATDFTLRNPLLAKEPFMADDQNSMTFLFARRRKAPALFRLKKLKNEAWVFDETYGTSKLPYYRNHTVPISETILFPGRDEDGDIGTSTHFLYKDQKSLIGVIYPLSGVNHPRAYRAVIYRLDRNGKIDTTFKTVIFDLQQGIEWQSPILNFYPDLNSNTVIVYARGFRCFPISGQICTPYNFLARLFL